MFDYHVAQRRKPARGWDVLRKDGRGDLFRISSTRETLTRAEAERVARLLAGHASRVIIHDKVYPLDFVFPASPFAQSHI